MNRTAIIGASGFIGQHLFKLFRSFDPQTIGTGFSSVKEELVFFDIRNPRLSLYSLNLHSGQTVLITSAKPNIDFCERNVEESEAVNVKGMLELIEELGRIPVHCIFLSTDYVFDGCKGQYGDEAATNPATRYGQQKATVEKAIPSLVKNYTIIRLSKIFGLKPDDNTLITAMGRALVSGELVTVADDQFFSPTYVNDLCRAITFVQSERMHGIVNLCSPERWSRYMLAQRLSQILDISPSKIHRVKLHDIPGQSGRPLDTSMKCSLPASVSSSLFRPMEYYLTKLGELLRERQSLRP